MKLPPQQKCICWNLDANTPIQERNRLISEGNEVQETVVPGYCPGCGYNFNLTVLNVNSNEPWYMARMSCPKCMSEGFAGQFRLEHRKMKIKCYGCISVVALVILAVVFIIRSCS